MCSSHFNVVGFYVTLLTVIDFCDIIESLSFLQVWSYSAILITYNIAMDFEELEYTIMGIAKTFTIVI